VSRMASGVKGSVIPFTVVLKVSRYVLDCSIALSMRLSGSGIFSPFWHFLSIVEWLKDIKFTGKYYNGIALVLHRRKLYKEVQTKVFTLSSRRA